ncbi:TetR/AcrR family transcriptional regulator [Paenibacillus donghaensis]|uniref:TetR/AcrR family transcriptional regulator C-terminal domain-containing protein n=1 Tax=Paenibacillus donghaensis TaxID=414771 RepID=UPI00188364FC|nr:TetR/AcrR family transcriptional regulator C-terminal domain-containing protein [Paenibacillus donghaensis]MBE9917802.1 TetR/AcrR family transcriptional regulator [Paenibacillus donghaensis]
MSTPNRRPHISEEKITTASWKLLENQGIGNFTMRNLAKELNVQAPTIYWYFKNKQSLFQTLANLVSREIINDLPKNGNWRGSLQLSATVIRSKLQQFPCSAQILMKTRPEADYLQLFESLLKMIEPAPLTDEQKFSYISHLFNFVINYVIDEYEQRMLAVTLDEENSEESSLDLSQFELLHRMHEADLFKLIGSDELFYSGIDLLLDGIEKRVMANEQGN